MKFIEAVCSDGKAVFLELESMRCCKLIKNMIKELGDADIKDQVIEFPEFTSDALKKVLQWVYFHLNNPTEDDPLGTNEEHLTPWDSGYVKQMSPDILVQVIVTSYHLGIKPLYTLACKQAAQLIIGKSVDEIRELFKITNDIPQYKEERYDALCEEKLRLSEASLEAEKFDM